MLTEGPASADFPPEPIMIWSASSRDRWLIAYVALMILATAAFVIGVAVERNQTDSGPPSEATAESSGHVEGDEHSEDGAEEAHNEAEESDEQLLGIDVETNEFVALAVLAALLLAGVAWWRPDLAVLALGLLFCIAAATLDVREVAHQVDENREAVAFLAGIVATLHVVAAIAAGIMLTRMIMPRSSHGLAA